MPYIVEEINRSTQGTLSLSNDCLEKIRARLPCSGSERAGFTGVTGRILHRALG